MSGRDITAAAEAVITAPNVPVCIFVSLEFPSGTLRFTNAGITMVWDSVSWLGAGNLAQIESVSEVAGVQASALAVRFSGIDPAYVTAILEDQYQGNTGRIWVAPLDADDQPVLDPILIFEGTMDEPTVTVGTTAEITITLENIFVDWDRPRVRMYSDADQQYHYPGDRFFEYVAQLESTSLTWGTYHGPVAPDPLRIMNRNIDRVARLIPGAKQLVVDPIRKIGDVFSKVFGW